MANTYTNLDDLFTAIADSIRAKTNSTSTIIADTFPLEIENLRTGFDYANQAVTVVPDYAFSGCEDLNNVNCYNFTSVGVGAFENCTNLKTAILYEGVTSVGENAFKGCSNLTIYCEAESKPEGWHENWNPDDCEVVWGCVLGTWNISKTSEDNVIATLYDGGYTLIVSGSGDTKGYTNPNGQPWSRSSIKSIIICDNVTSIGYLLFYKCENLTSITIPDSVTRIDGQAFQGCTSLTSVTIPYGTTCIGGGAFENCTSLTSITIPDSVIDFSDAAFNNTAYYNDDSNWESDVLYINNHLIEAKNNLSGSYKIKDGVISIATYAFSSCTGLSSLVIPKSVTVINVGAFMLCTGLTSITYTGTIAQWNAITFDANWNVDTGNYTIHCTDGDIAKDGTVTYH